MNDDFVSALGFDTTPEVDEEEVRHAKRFLGKINNYFRRIAQENATEDTLARYGAIHTIVKIVWNWPLHGLQQFAAALEGGRLPQAPANEQAAIPNKPPAEDQETKQKLQDAETQNQQLRNFISTLADDVDLPMKPDQDLFKNLSELRQRVIDDHTNARQQQPVAATTVVHDDTCMSKDVVARDYKPMAEVAAWMKDLRDLVTELDKATHQGDPEYKVMGIGTLKGLFFKPNDAIALKEAEDNLKVFAKLKDK